MHKPQILSSNLTAAYRLMAQDEGREEEALEWAEATIGDVADEGRSQKFDKQLKNPPKIEVGPN